MSNKVTPFLWFDKEAEQAAKFYTSIFEDSKLININEAGEGGPVTTVEFAIGGQRFMGMNAGPQFKFNEAISLLVNCENQEEVDYYWEKLIANGGEESMCGWLKDKFGLSWQIVPRQLYDYIGNPDPEKAKKAMEAMLKMRKIVLAELEAAVK